MQRSGRKAGAAVNRRLAASRGADPRHSRHTRAPALRPCRLQVAAPFIHDITISDSASMNVFADSAGWNLNLDHHR